MSLVGQAREKKIDRRRGKVNSRKSSGTKGQKNTCSENTHPAVGWNVTKSDIGEGGKQSHPAEKHLYSVTRRKKRATEVVVLKKEEKYVPRRGRNRRRVGKKKSAKGMPDFIPEVAVGQESSNEEGKRVKREGQKVVFREKSNPCGRELRSVQGKP